MWKRPDGRFEERVRINERRVSFYSTEKTESKALADIQRQVLRYRDEEHRTRHNFLRLAEAMLEERESILSSATLSCYEFTLKHLSPFYDKDIERISPADVQNLLNDMARRKYSQSAITKTKILFGLTLDYAILHGVKVNNFMKSIKTPKNAIKNKVTAPDDKVIELVSKSVHKANFGVWAFILLYTGMRKGELAALQRKDIDFDRKTISITKAAEYVSNTPKIKEPKTANSIRSIPILEILYPVLKEVCDGLKNEDYIFGGATPLSNTMIKKRWTAYCKEIGYNIHQHQLRHAYAKLLYRSGVDPKTTQGILGHQDIQTTMNIYTDFAKDATQRSIEMVNNYVSQKGTA